MVPLLCGVLKFYYGTVGPVCIKLRVKYKDVTKMEKRKRREKRRDGRTEFVNKSRTIHGLRFDSGSHTVFNHSLFIHRNVRSVPTLCTFSSLMPVHSVLL